MSGIPESKHKRVVYVYDKQLSEECDKIPNIRGRAILVHNLIKSYGLLSQMQLKQICLANEEDLVSFHSRDYINFLQKMDNCNDIEKHEEDQLEFGLSYDCPMIEGIYKFVQTIAGASLTSARLLVDGSADIAINWCGGWHHAQRDEAEGFCYVNDAVLAIHKLRERFERVLYIDLDLHHGNGVENAFAYTPHVFTLSLHKFEPGFYPGSGSLDDVGFGRGKFHAVNVPLKDGVRDKAYMQIFQQIASKIHSVFQPNAIVMQCGCDGLNGDPQGAFNLTATGMTSCVEYILSWQIPTLFLGGGGYHLPNAARCWTLLTAAILGRKICSAIPEWNPDFLHYSPDFEIDITAGNRSDTNSTTDLQNIMRTINERLDQIQVLS
ncbi:Histone deacetylase 8 [Blattella germanica]|nr:Histone deacetylase 8 [Blattella germanica]